MLWCILEKIRCTIHYLYLQPPFDVPISGIGNRAIVNVVDNLLNFFSVFFDQFDKHIDDVGIKTDFAQQ